VKTAAQEWSERHRPATPRCDSLEAEYHSKMSTRLRIWALARKLESELHQAHNTLKRIRAWDMVYEPAPGNDEPCHDAPQIRQLIDAVINK
jgi:hypothetical protein